MWLDEADRSDFVKSSHMNIHPKHFEALMSRLAHPGGKSSRPCRCKITCPTKDP